MDIGTGLAQFGENFAAGITQYHNEEEKKRNALAQADAFTRMELPDPNNPEKTIPLFSKEARAAWDAKSNQEKARMAGAQEAMARMQFQVLQAAGRLSPKMPVQVQGQTFQVSPEKALETTVEAPSREATIEHTKELTEASRASRKPETSVMMDIGGGNFARVPVSDLIKHPEFLKDQNAKDLNNQVFAATGLSIPQIAQGWNKRIINGQLTFEAPVVQQTIDPISQKPIPKYNADGTPVYEQQPNPKYKEKKGLLGTIVETPGEAKTLTKTMRYQVPQEFTPDVLRLTGTEGVSGSDQIKIPEAKPSGTRIVPGSVQSGAAQKGERRVINGQLAEWDGKGWLPVGP